MATGVCLRGDAGGVKLSPVGAEVSVQVSSECQLFYNVHKAIDNATQKLGKNGGRIGK